MTSSFDEIYTMSCARGLKYLHKAPCFSFCMGHCVYTSHHGHQMTLFGIGSFDLSCEGITQNVPNLCLPVLFNYFIHFVAFFFGKCTELLCDY